MVKLFGGAEPEETVPRWLYEQLRDDHRALLDKYHSLRVSHAANPHQPARVVLPPPGPESVAAHRATEETFGELLREMMARGKSEAEARAVLGRMRGDAIENVSGMAD